MTRTILLRIASIAVIAICAVSCIYPFDAEFKDSERRIVIEGSILIGDVSEFTMTYTASLNQISMPDSPDGAIWVECEDGTMYKSESKTGRFTIDLTNAPADKRYRLRAFNHDNNLEYETPFMEVLQPATIDELSFIPNMTKNRLAVALTMHSPGNKYFRWSYKENWEYHSHYKASLYYDTKWNSVLPFENGENNYYCWDSEVSDDIMIFSTADQTEDKFVDMEFHTISRYSNKLQYIYYIEVSIEPLTEEAYMYWNNIHQNSDQQGDMFSPTPSQMVGNIACLDKDKGYAIGYISASKAAKGHIFYNDSEHQFYVKSTRSVPDPEILSRSAWSYNYKIGRRPVWADKMNPELVYWTEREYCDCTATGGNKNKPSFWPNDDK